MAARTKLRDRVVRDCNGTTEKTQPARGCRSGRGGGLLEQPRRRVVISVFRWEATLCDFRFSSKPRLKIQPSMHIPRHLDCTSNFTTFRSKMSSPGKGKGVKGNVDLQAWEIVKLNYTWLDFEMGPIECKSLAGCFVCFLFFVLDEEEEEAAEIALEEEEFEL